MNSANSAESAATIIRRQKQIDLLLDNIENVVRKCNDTANNSRRRKKTHYQIELSTEDFQTTSPENAGYIARWSASRIAPRIAPSFWAPSHDENDFTCRTTKTQISLIVKGTMHRIHVSTLCWMYQHVVRIMKFERGCVKYWVDDVSLCHSHATEWQRVSP